MGAGFGGSLYMYRWLVAALLLWGAPAAAQSAAAPPAAPALFDALPTAAAPETPAAGLGAVRGRSVAVNPVSLGGLLGPGETRATLNLFDDLAVEVTTLKAVRSPLGHQILQGELTDGGSASFAIIDGTVTAQISTGNRRITVQPLPGGAHRITEFTKAPLADDTFRPAVRPGDTGAAPLSSIEKPSAAATQIRILVAYTPKALTLYPSLATLRATVALMIADLNTTLANSQIPVEAVLAGIEQVNYTEPAGLTSQQLMDTARRETGDFARLQTVRYATSADIVSVLTGYSDTTSCGRGSLNDYLDTVNQSQVRFYTENGLNVVSVSGSCQSIVTLSFAHEVGHNLGASHDRYVLTNPLPGPQFYAAGYVDLTGKFRDTMAYDDQCDANAVSCPRLLYFSNPSLTYNGRPLGVAADQPTAADASRRIREIAPYVAQFHGLLSIPTQPVLSVLVNGSGIVTGGTIDCGVTCAATLTSGASVTLTPSAPAGWSFASWGGACSGTAAACTVSMTASKAVTATFVPTLRFGPVFSSAQPTSQSFIRLANTGSAAATATVKLWDYTTGASLGQWTSPSIPAGTAPQYGISTIESALTGAKPQYYAVAVQTEMTGTTQHVLWKPSDGTLTNLSTCDTGITAGTGQVASVHSSVLDAPGYPSSVAINNTSASTATSVTLGIYDARNGTKLGTYAAASIPANSKLIVTVAAIEAGARITPAPDMFHYTIKPEGAFTGFLQHLVNNQQVGVITDMTTVCAFGVAPTPLQTIAIRAPGPLYSTAQVSSQSFLRFTNTGATAGSVAVTLRNAATGARFGQWTSPSIAPGAAPQYGISEIESALNISTKPQYYAAMIETQITGSVAHVLWKPSDNILTNLSTCEAGVSSNTGLVASVHSSLLDASYPSTVAVSNTGSAAQAFTLGVFDARNGTRLGTYTTTAIPANGQQLLAVAAIERAINVTPAGAMFHYVIKLESGTGFLQHLVNNQAKAVITDMTTVCQLPAKAVSFSDCAPNITPRCTAAVGTPTAGQLKQASSWQNYDVSLTAGRAYTIDVKGASTGNGTLAQPYVFIYQPGGSSVLAQGGGGGTGNDARLTFTPSTTGTYTIQVSTYVFADNAGTFVLTVN